MPKRFGLRTIAVFLTIAPVMSAMAGHAYRHNRAVVDLLRHVESQNGSYYVRQHWWSSDSTYRIPQGCGWYVVSEINLMGVPDTSFIEQHSGPLAGLEHFRAEFSGFDDEDMAFVAKQCPHLRSLGLQGTRVTDRSVSSILGLSQLCDVNVVDTEITDDGIEQLRSRSFASLSYGQSPNFEQDINER